jgi:uncharacterized DUF497 family protein
MNELEFEWDEDKAAANLTKHGVSFLTAAEAFANEMIEKIDDREDYGEVRFVYRVVYTWRNHSLVRIISAQKASRHERELYYRETLA